MPHGHAAYLFDGFKAIVGDKETGIHLPSDDKCLN